MPQLVGVGSLITAAAVAIAVYLVTKGLYRVYFSRASHIPGPKLAALTYLYQSYYDIWPYKGQWLFQQVKLHKRYGPVVRVGPDEIHIDDPDFYTEFAGTSTKRRDKSTTWYWFSGLKDNIGLATFATLDHDHHALRRSALSGFFSKRKVQDLEARIRVHVQKMTKRLLGYSETHEVLNLMYLTSALTLDVISEYSFGKSTMSLDTPELGGPIRTQLENGVQMHPFARQFRTFVRFMIGAVGFLARNFGMFKEFENFNILMDNLTKPAYEKAVKEKDEGEDLSETSIVQAMVQNKALPAEERTRARIQAEGGNLIGAGTETTGRTLAVGLFHVLNNPSIHSRLLSELRSIMPTPTSDLPSVVELTKLPYLTACLHESTRLAHGVAGRLVRIAPDDDIVCNGVRIPKGITFSMSHYIQHTNPEKFPDPFVFDPERYLGENASKTLRYLVPFGRGPRMCLGLNLAWSEMYLSFASLLGTVDMELVGTTIRDVTVEREFFMGLFPVDSKGIRVKVHGLLK